MNPRESLHYFIQELIPLNKGWGTLAGFINKGAAFDCAEIILKLKADKNGYFAEPIGRKYRIVDADGRMQLGRF
jgi:hypothetical protein